MDVQKLRQYYIDRKPGAIGAHRFYSVVVPFVEKEGQLNFMYETRAMHMKTQPGEICFPGGHIEKGESPREGALREFQEETGIFRSEVELLGQGDTMYGNADYTLYTFVGIVSYDAYLNANIQEDEVEELFLVPVDELADNIPSVYRGRMLPSVPINFPYERVGISSGYNWRTGQNDVIVYNFDDRVLWGITAKITNSILSELGLQESRCDTLWKGAPAVRLPESLSQDFYNPRARR